MRHRGKSARIREQLIEIANERGPSSRMPTVRELCEQLGTTPATLDGVLAELEARQILWRRQGSGIFVSARLTRRSVALIFNPAYLRGMAASPFWSLLIDAVQAGGPPRDMDVSFHFAAASERQPVPGVPTAAASAPTVPVFRGLEAELRDGRVHGVLTIGMDAAAIDWIEALGVPTVVFAGLGPCRVAADIDSMTSLQVDALAGRGCRRIALWRSVAPFIYHPVRPALQTEPGFTAFSAALTRHGLPLHPELIQTNAERIPAGGGVVTATAQEQGYETAMAAFGPRASLPPPDGIASGDDMLTLGALAAFAELGIRVGEDVQVATHANVGSPVLVGYEDRLTLVLADPTAVAETMLELLERRIAGDTALPDTVRLPFRLGSAALPPTPADDSKEIEENRKGKAARQANLLLRTRESSPNAMPSTATVTDLTCEYHADPLGIDIASPRLSWKLAAKDAGRRGLRQTAYQVLAATSREKLTAGEADLWDSGRVGSDQSVHVEYGGKPLASGQRAWWTVRVWDETGAASEPAPAAFWEAGLLDGGAWAGAEWIGADLAGGPYTSPAVPHLRRTFTLPAAAGDARLYVTALGLYEVTINGKKVGSDELTPGWTDYDARVRYHAYDVTDLLKPGENVIGALLGDGWYCGFVGGGPRQLWGDRPRLLLTLTVDGQPTLVSDGSWKAGFGPLLSSDMLQGEHYDARRELPGWDSDPKFDDSAWPRARVFPDPGIPRVSGQRGVPVVAAEEIVPVADPQETPHWPAPFYVFDLGQNMVGRVRLKVKGDAGTTIRLRFAETLKGGPAAKTGDIYTENLRSAKQTDYYTLKGDPNGEIWEPRFTFHGFRYVEYAVFPPTHPTSQAEWKPEKPSRDAITGIVLHSDIPKTGDFDCSDPLLNQLQKNIDWGQRGNFLEVPTDCPQRDERLGWTGDAQVFVRTAAFNRDVASFFTKWTQDLRDAQAKTDGGYPPIVPITDRSRDGGPAWADAGIICPWTVYLCYGDDRLLAEHYDSMRRFVDYLTTHVTKDGIRSYEGMPTFQGFGDWLALDGSGRTEGGTPKDLIGTAFTACDARLMGKIARLLGKDGDAAGYDGLFESTRAAFQKRYVTPDGLIASGTQTAYVLALYFDLLPDSLRAAAVENLVRSIQKNGGKLATGFVSTAYLPYVLADAGRWDTAFGLLHQTRWPSWLYAVTQGATTIWERWDGWTPEKGFQDAGMNSFNHYAYGAVGAWLYERVAGLGLDETAPGGKRLILRPHAAGSGLTHARATLETPYGKAESAWKVEEGGTLVWDVTVPPNAEAIAYLPAPAGGDANAPGTAEPTVLEAGTYRFTVAG